MLFVFVWLIIHCLIILTMIHDNFWWVKTSPELKLIRQLPFFGKGDLSFTDEFGRTHYSYSSYMLRYRAWAVIRQWKDQVPAGISSLGIATGLTISIWLGIAIVFLSMGVAMIIARYF